MTVTTVRPIFTLTPTQTPIVSLSSESAYFKGLNPMQIQMPSIESNLLRNSGFENGLSDWEYSDNIATIDIFETDGVNGKAFCSHKYPAQKDSLENQHGAFSQEVLIDPTQTYFFSGWVKLNKAHLVYALAELYNGSEYIGWARVTQIIGILPDGETTSGWVFIHGELSTIFPGTNRIIFEIVHGEPPPNNIDSTVCVDDLVFGKIVK
jgi:hypothetical protein